jgi:hypothetical protein
MFTVYYADRAHDTELCGGGALIVVSEAVSGVKHRSSREVFE